MNIPAEFMGLTSEAVVIARGSVISYANKAAKAIIGASCEGRNIRDIFGTEIAAVQASSYSASTVINGRSFILRSSVTDGMKLYIFSPSENSGDALNSTLLTTINSTLMNLSLSVSQGVSLAEKLDNKELFDCIAAVNRDYYRLRRLSSNVTVAENFFSHTLPFFPLPYDVSRIVRSYLEGVQSLCPSIEFIVDTPEELIINLDRQLIFAALSNLVSNCIVHAEGCTKVSVTVTDTNFAALISVSDNGCDIAPELLSGVFNRYRNAATLSTCIGAGLGMTVVRAASEAHGGTLLVESRESIGTTVKFSLSKDTRKCSNILGIAKMTEDIDMQELYTSLPDILPPEVLL